MKRLVINSITQMLIVMGVLISTPANSFILQNNKEIKLLEMDKVVERELKGDERHSYTVEAIENQYLRLSVMQKGVDVVVKVYDPDGKEVFEVDSPNGTEGEEPVEIVTEKKGFYKLEVASLEKTAPAGKYEVKLQEQRRAEEGEGEKIQALQKAAEINTKAGVLYQQSKYNEVEPLLKKVLEIRKKVVGLNHPDTATSLNNLAEVYRSQGRYVEAEPLLLQALEIRKTVLGLNHPDIAQSLNNLALLYYSRGRYVETESLLKQAVEVYKTVLSQSHPYTANGLHNLAGLYKEQGRYVEAELLLLQALEIYKTVLGLEHPDTATSLNNLAEVYRSQGRYVEAEPLLLQALEMRKTVLGQQHPYTASSLNDLALLYHSQGRYVEAEPLLLQALEIRKTVLGLEHPDTATSLNNLAGLYKEQGRYVEAELLLLQALEIYKTVLGLEHPDTATSLNNLAEVYRSQGRYVEAEPLLLQALEMRKTVLGQQHPYTASSLNNLALLYPSLGRYSEVESLLLQTLEINKTVLGQQHPYTASSLNNLALFYILKGDRGRGLEYKIEADNAREREYSRNLLAGSEKQKLLYLNKTAEEFDQTLSIHLQQLPESKEAAKAALTALLRRKGRALDVMTSSIEMLRSRASKEDRELLSRLADAKSYLSATELQGVGKEGVEKYKEKVKEIEKRVEELESQVSSKSREYRTQIQAVNLESIIKAIPEEAVLVEFGVYRSFRFKTEKYLAPHYAVYVVNKQGEVKWVELGRASVINRAVTAFRQALYRNRGKLSNIESVVKPRARALDKLVMEKVRSLIGESKRVLIAPDGELNLIPFEALVDEKGKYLVQSYEISYLSSGRDLLRLENGVEHKQWSIVVANPAYGEGEGTKVGDYLLSVEPLPATAEEARRIKEIFRLEDEQLFLKEKANKTELKGLTRPEMLHIATHGYFLQAEKQEQSSRMTKIKKARLSTTDKEELSDDDVRRLKLNNPLLKSGLMLAGANVGKGDEGVITALEMTGLDLWGTKIVVLSACDTAVGEVRRGEGVYGLRRALVIAGTQTQLMSLWPVNDSGTRDLMVKYYEALKNGEGRSSGLRCVRLEFLKDQNLRHPYFWASFIQSGEWANLEGKR